MIDSNNKLKSLSKSLIESARKIMTEKKTDKDLAKLAPPYDKVTHGDVLVGRKVYTHDQVKAHKAKKGIKEDADMVVINAPVLSDINGELAEVLKRDPRDKSVHVQLEGMKYILKKGQYEELDEAVKNPYAVGMAAAMKATGDEPPLKKSTIVKAHKIAKKVAEEVEQIDEDRISDVKKITDKTGHQAAADVLTHHGFTKKGTQWTRGKERVSKHVDPNSGRSYYHYKKMSNGNKPPEEDLIYAWNGDKTIGHAANLHHKLTEEVEQIDELSKKTLKSYQKKATTSSEKAWNKADKEEDKAMSTDGTKYPEKQERHMKAAGDAIKTWRKREAGLGLAKQKLAKEEVEQIDELSTKTLTKYRGLARGQLRDMASFEPSFGKNQDQPKSRQVYKAKRLKGLELADKKLAKEEVEDLDEAVEVSHDRYRSSHGKKASGPGAWMFTHKRSGEAKGDDTFTAPATARSFTDAAKHAKAWAKSKGHRTVYVMEEVEQIDEISRKTLASYIKKAVPSKRSLEDKSDRLHKQAHDSYQAGAHKMSDAQFDASDKFMKKSVRRGEGINKAADKLAKEEVEDLDEAYTIRSKGYNNVEVVHKGKVVGRFNDPHSARMHIAKLNKNASVKEEVEDVELSQEEIENIEAILADLDDESED